ncbi:RING-H2 finger protein ATL16-like [Gastrolobium bilobum]|uniref:RING-H2 finger protein ATL16-like n=1 Tax=Gastrolobium bilobum TaxID=150636 RepID=UPI002AB01217|nr:RING-H2 finger protein ATL16-like [Gastrolobium bilobum]
MSPDSAKPDEPSQWKPREVCSIIIVCVLFLIISYYGIFKRLLCEMYRASTTRNHVQRRLLDESIPNDHSLQLQSIGLELSVVHSLPISQFKKNEEDHKPINVDCAICLGEFEEGVWIKHLPNCTHGFHVSCIDTWFQSHSNCPICRSHVYLDLPANLECSVSSYTLTESLRREDFIHERAAHFQSIRSEILAIRQQSSPG